MKYKNLILAILVFGVALFLYKRYRIAPSIEFKKLTLMDLDKNPVSLEDYEGKNVFITMWAPWCGDCLAEMPDLQFVKEQLVNDNFVFLAISGYDIQKEKIYANKTNFDFVYLHMTEKLKEIDVHAIPTNYIINSKGKVVYEKVGAEANWRSQETINRIRELVK